MKSQLKLITNIFLTSIALSVLLGSFLSVFGPINQTYKINKKINPTGKSSRSFKRNLLNRKSKLSIDKGKAWLIRKELNFNAMKQSIKMLVGIHDFSTFRSSSCAAKNPIRKMNIAAIIADLI